jgi:hypothetical protein
MLDTSVAVSVLKLTFIENVPKAKEFSETTVASPVYRNDPFGELDIGVPLLNTPISLSTRARLVETYSVPLKFKVSP